MVPPRAHSPLGSPTGPRITGAVRMRAKRRALLILPSIHR
jgi:hypothetical protein